MFKDKKQYKTILKGLTEGSVYPDKPEELRGLDKVFDVWTHELEEKAPKKSLTYRSHFGDLQYWHGMVFDEKDPIKFQEKLIFRLVTKVLDAKSIAENDPKKAGHLIGEALHTIEDTFAPSHVARNKEMQITRFQDYSKQSKAHELGDIEKGNERQFEAAKNAVREIYGIVFQKEQNSEQVKKQLEALLKEKILNLNKDDESNVKVHMGGSEEQYMKITKENNSGGS